MYRGIRNVTSLRWLLPRSLDKLIFAIVLALIFQVCCTVLYTVEHMCLLLFTPLYIVVHTHCGHAYRVQVPTFKPRC